MATTIRDILTDIVKEASKVKEKAINKQSEQLDDDMQPLDEIEDEIISDLVDEYISIINKKIVG